MCYPPHDFVRGGRIPPSPPKSTPMVHTTSVFIRNTQVDVHYKRIDINEQSKKGLIKKEQWFRSGEVI